MADELQIEASGETGTSNGISSSRTDSAVKDVEDQRAGTALADSAPDVRGTVDTKERDEPDYEIGYKRPPRQTRIKPGERRNPMGRPRGSANKKDIIDRALNKRVAVRRGDKICMVPLLEAMIDTFALKAVAGDRHAAGIIINVATKSGSLGGRTNATQNEGREQLAPAATGTNPSDALVESIDLSLLSEDDQMELSRIAEAIDAGGDVTALNNEEFMRLKKIVNRGRENDVVAKANENLDEAA